MADLKFAIFGTGFWSQYQLAAWREVKGAECVALYNRTLSRAVALANTFGIPAVYDDAELLLQEQSIDFVDIITDVDTHPHFVELAARHGKAVICQKPMAPSLDLGRKMVKTCRESGVPLYIHENFRWQTPTRRIKHLLDRGTIGQAFRARFDFISGFPVFENQPFLRDLKEFILTDVGCHMLDVVRYLLGEAASVFCTTARVHTDIQGEDVATLLIRSSQGASALVSLAYAGNTVERDAFPQPLLFIEGTGGTLELAPNFEIRVTTSEGTRVESAQPPRYVWADPDYEVVHASIVPCNENLLSALNGSGSAETTGEDNLRTLALVFAAYESAATGRVVDINAKGQF